MSVVVAVVLAAALVLVVLVDEATVNVEFDDAIAAVVYCDISCIMVLV